MAVSQLGIGYLMNDVERGTWCMSMEKSLLVVGKRIGVM
jgi:hypothetical protein